MADKKIIDKKNIKENNPNDDEEILKNMDTNVSEDPGKGNTRESGSDEEKTDGSDTLGIP